RLVDVVDEDAEMVQPGVVHALADLVALKAQDGEVDGAVADVVAVSQRSVIAADELEIERLAVEIGHRVRVFAGDGEVAQLGHGRFSPPYSAASLSGAGSGSAPAQPCSAMSNSTPSGPKNFFSKYPAWCP